jgi:hypothetical protein
MLGSTKDDIRKTLFEWDGLTGTQTTLFRKQLNRFYPKNILREMYRLDFRYQKDDQFASVEILYRPFEHQYHNTNATIDTQAVLTQLLPMIGQPQLRLRRTSPGITGYNAYVWEDDKMFVLLDHKDQHPNNPVLLQVRAKQGDMATQYLAQSH